MRETFRNLYNTILCKGSLSKFFPVKIKKENFDAREGAGEENKKEKMGGIYLSTSSNEILSMKELLQLGERLSQTQVPMSPSKGLHLTSKMWRPC